MATRSIGAVALRQVEDQVRERGLQQTDHALQVVGRDQRHVFQLHRPRQQVQPRGVFGQRPLQQREVEPRDVLRHVDQRVVGNRVEKHVGVAQAQVEVDQGHASCVGSAARTQPRLTARLVVPTPPVAPATAITVLPRSSVSPRPKRWSPIRSSAATRSSIRTGWVQELLDAGPHRPQDQVAVGRRADDQDAALGRRLVQLADQLQGLLRVVVERHDADVGMRLGHDVGEELVARALGFEPDRVHAQQHRSSALRAMRRSGSTMANRRTLLMYVSFDAATQGVRMSRGAAPTRERAPRGTLRVSRPQLGRTP